MTRSDGTTEGLAMIDREVPQAFRPAETGILPFLWVPRPWGNPVDQYLQNCDREDRPSILVYEFRDGRFAVRFMMPRTRKLAGRAWDVLGPRVELTLWRGNRTRPLCGLRGAYFVNVEPGEVNRLARVLLEAAVDPNLTVVR